MLVIDNISDMRAFSRGFKSKGKKHTIAFVPTMGALHRGHLKLVKHAQNLAAHVVVSIYVNPLQFDNATDLQGYPRTLSTDKRSLKRAGVKALFLPRDALMYPEGFQTSVKPGALARRYEGQFRKGHFTGMLTVVLKLLNIVEADVACFGEKDFQQLALIRQMAADFDLATKIEGVPIVREKDGLAMSSRNRLLTASQRKQALVLSKSIAWAASEASAGETRTRVLLQGVTEQLSCAKDFELEYASLVDPLSLKPLRKLKGAGRLLLAGQMGGRRSVRLIDNGAISA